MAAPKVFVSSTCYDLGGIREQLRGFIESFGFEAVLSENGDVFYHPDLHTHVSCVHEVENCQLFILLIGGRFGGRYDSDKTKSVTNAEYETARQHNIPVFTYVSDSVLSDHHTYRVNKEKKFVSDITYPAIEKKEHALDIFSFVDEVRLSKTNNALEGFSSFQSIENHLRKQWAGMFFDLLKSREVKRQIDATNHLISGVVSSSDKLEALVKSLYLSSGKGEAETEIQIIEVTSNVEKFYREALTPNFTFGGEFGFDISKFDFESISKVSTNNGTWHEYLVECGLFEYENDSEKGSDPKVIVCSLLTGGSQMSGFGFSIEDKKSDALEDLFIKGVQVSSAEQRKLALMKIVSSNG